MKNFFKNIDKIIVGSVSALFFTVIQIILYIWDSNYKVSMYIVIIILILCYLVCLIIYSLFKAQKKEVIYYLPKIKTICKDEKQKITFILEKNDLFSIHSLVSIYYQLSDDEIEIFLGLGYIESIHDNGNFQVIFYNFNLTEKVENILKELNDKKRNAIKIKPTISKEYLI